MAINLVQAKFQTRGIDTRTTPGKFCKSVNIFYKGLLTPRERPAHFRPQLLQCRAAVNAAAPSVTWPSGLEAAIIDGVKFSSPKPGEESPPQDSKEVVVFGGLGAHLNNQGVAYYNRKELDALLPSLDSYWQDLASNGPEIPAYAKEPFHVWHGHSNWPAAANSEAVMSMFAFMALSENDQRTIDGQMRRSRELVMQRVIDAVQGALDVPPEAVTLGIDLGCGAGQPTNLAAAAFPNAKVIGLDASPHMLAWAKLRSDPTGPLASKELLPQEVAGVQRVELRRGLAEDTGLAAGSADFALLLFVAHELPVAARRDICKEAARVLRPGGVFAIVDHSHEGSVPWRVFKLAQKPGLKFIGDAFQWLLNVGAPEPWLREFYENSIEETMVEAGLEVVGKVSVTMWQDAVLARKI